MSEREPVNTEGFGTYTHAWSPSVGWWAWSPRGLLTGEADTKDEAERQAREAMGVTKFVPKGQG